MKRLLLYVHFNKFNRLSPHVGYQLEKMRSLFSRVVFISNSDFKAEDQAMLKEQGLIDDFIQRQNSGFDFAAWRDGMAQVGWNELTDYDSITTMNDTCFGPLWDLEPIYQKFEADANVDFWGLTNHRKTKSFPEHIQSYFISFSQKVVASSAFQEFWQGIEDFSDVQEVIGQYETRVTTALTDGGFTYDAVFNTLEAPTEGMLHPDFSYYNPTAILNHRVPFIKVKTIDANQSITPYILNQIEASSDYPVDLIVSHMTNIGQPDLPYLLARKYLEQAEAEELPAESKVAVHLHVFYVDLLQEFLEAFKAFHFAYDLFITTDKEEKQSEIQAILDQNQVVAQIFVTGNIGRDVLPMLKLKDQLKSYDYIGHFHTKKSKEADYWAGQSWRQELIAMLVEPANQILAQMASNDRLGLVIADMPTFFRFNKIVVAWNENLIAPKMEELWEKMELKKSIDFKAMDTFVMSYGTYAWFKYDALSPLFDLNLTDQDVPAEPLPQNSILHAIERLLVYIAWDKHYDYHISPSPITMTPFIENKQLNTRANSSPNTYVDFTYMGGIKGALKYIIVGPARAIKYIVKRLLKK
ncbi:alpha-L-Rha alpha-1,3-L-rhamnosyltransferase [Streptococcus sobrinus]|mgnify:CR=1 FL=1|uniref:rhamnan synthesis F family protein n=1 Tax=Streptococcus sobrinus TaxID=1310 RepID=UPI000BA1ACEA|nr:rhamnan synthesis F family protein [Streptococcus sobrinus]OZV23897.1 alpha-L-Rha alpha-1,3-L-rhamnosyltransferase [Streptococcus sobrinus]